jgi:hypothetical protein
MFELTNIIYPNHPKAGMNIPNHSKKGRIHEPVVFGASSQENCLGVNSHKGKKKRSIFKMD